MYRADTDPRPQRVSEFDEVQLAGRESLSSGGEQHILREEIMELSRENERETSCAPSSLDAFSAKREEILAATTSCVALHQRAGPSDGGHPDQEKMEGRTGNRTEFEAGNALPRVDISIADIRRVDLSGRSVTSMSLANAVEATMGEPATKTNSEASLLWSLAIRQCHLSSLIPVAGLLHHLDGLMGLEVHEVAGLALAGVERVLADGRCLSTVTIRKCGLTYLPRLQSGSIEVLDLSDNELNSASGLEMLFRLKELNLAGNNLSTLADLRPLISLGAGCLTELNLDRNPVQNIPRYRESAAVMLPSIQRLDGVATARPWRARKTVDNSTGGNQGCTTPPRIRDKPVDGYLSDGAAWVRRRAGQGSSRCNSKSRAERQDVGDKHGFVRGLAGLGLIWGGTPTPRTSRSVCSSPDGATILRGGSDSAALFGNSLDGGFGELERSGGLVSATRSSKRCRPPSPARCRQMEADNARSRPRDTPKPRAHWDTRFRHHHHQELVARTFAKKRAAELSRHTQTAIMDRLAQPVRGRLHHLKEGCNETGCEGEASLAGDTDLQAWNALFTEAILAESPGLIDRPTALKQPDGQWRGVISTTNAGERKTFPMVSRTPPQFPGPALDSQSNGTNNISTAALPPHERNPEPPIHGTSLEPTEALPSANITTSPVSSPVSRLQEDRASQSPPSQPTTPPPPRATLVLPDAMTSDDEADLSRATGPHSAGRCSFMIPGTPLGDSQRRSACDGQRKGTTSTMSSPRPEGGCHYGAAPRIKRQPESRSGSVTRYSSPLRTRTPRMLKTSRDFAQTIRRVYKVDLSEEGARSLFQQLDSDRDGALGAEDLLRGAPIIASSLLRAQSEKPDGSSRQGSQNTICAGRTWNRNTNRDRIRRGDARSSTRRLQYHKQEAPIEDDPMPRRISFSGEEGTGFRPPTIRSVSRQEIPRRLEDWRIPEEKCPHHELRNGAACGKTLDEECRLGQTWS